MTYWSHHKGSWTAWPLKMGPIGRREMSVTDYKSTLREIPYSVDLIYAATEA
jgi:hypothetical protein